ncbi:hypothetical protein [Haloferula sp. A504]|uniref:hypothetical protein n=1 Tax=Haloferula sp. A504 TaxID=3373601 RepID=UPI0031BE0136|nr:hypothetical protein [Verrucomicrobiaceae bacterium E54]
MGLLTGVVLVMVFLKANQSRRVDLEVGVLPAGVDTSPYMANLRDELASNATLIALQTNLSGEGEYWTPPLFWLRPRARVSSSSKQSGPNGTTWGQIHVIFTHHSEDGLNRLDEAFQAASRRVVRRVRSEYGDQWRSQLKARLDEIHEAMRIAESKGGIAGRDDIPLANEQERLEDDLQWLMGDGALGYELKIVGSIPCGPPAPWWQSPPAWVILTAKCAGYGLLAAFPAMFALEGLRPRRDGPEASLSRG